MSKLTVGSLFSGIGGLDLGLERAGFEIIWQSEIDPYASRVLAKHWPAAQNLGDITKIDWRNVERPDVVCGGFPCQPVSTAGKRLGQEDPRWLWPEFARCLRDLRPRCALLENVPGILAPVPVSDVQGPEQTWSIIGYLPPPFEEVLGDLVALGYDASWDSVPAALVGAPHLRYRVFVVAHADGRWELQPSGIVGEVGGWAGNSGESLALADAAGLQGWELLPERAGERATRPGGVADAAFVQPGLRNGNGRSHAGRGIAESELGGAPDGVSPRLDGVGRLNAWGPGWEDGVPRVATGALHRVDRLRCLGNAVVPQVAQFIGEQLMAVLDRERTKA